MCDNAYDLVGDDEVVARRKVPIEVGDTIEHPVSDDSPPYVHHLLDALMRHEPLDFGGDDIPDDVRGRLQAHFAARQTKTAELHLADSDALANLNGLLSAAIHAEFGALGAVLGANDDFSWMRTSLGILAKMNAKHIGWAHIINDRASLYVQAQTRPEDGREWIGVFAFGE